ncbi:MAG: YihA family ribosome biogenesis GTP-binding protein [Lachnospiraceae bacterium]|nr:YihA family ribosome biogenesis GTP-binding protein [Lachnospiraceae bacterium]
MVIKSIELETVCGVTSRLPEHQAPEFAFAGKSNVGKSSLINALSNRRSYARTSSQPGKTQTINFYRMNDAFYFVDLPGYGYAKVPEETKAKWGRMIEKYLNTSKMLKAVFLLIDMRHEPSGNDVQMYDWIVSCGFSPIVLLTKADKLSKNEQAKNLALIRKKLKVRESTVVIPVSAEKKTGIEEVLQTIEGLLTTEEAE